ncbi:MAG: YraN family protein [Candidatus Kryptoniota bacterium]
MKRVGVLGENLAEKFLQKSGYEIIERNYRFGHLEIDIIARKDRVISFVEVKTRKSLSFGKGEEAVNERKQNHLRKVAEHFIATHEINESVDFRFDIIVIEISRNSTWIRMIENAFY